MRNNMKLKKLFFGCNLSSVDVHKSQSYVNHLKVAINSCIANTDLNIHLMYCGSNDKLLDWLKSKPIKLIDISGFDIFNILNNYYEGNQLMIAKGAWQRVIISKVCEQLGYDDKHVLYTDIDVIFTENMRKPINIKVENFACAKEGGVHGHYNTGSMIINVPYFNSIYEPFVDFCIKQNFNFTAYDQGALNEFVGIDQITLLDHFEWNFAPYMHGDLKNCRIVHFHGNKAPTIEMFLDRGHDKFSPFPKLLELLPPVLEQLLHKGNNLIMHEVMDMYDKYLLKD